MIAQASRRGVLLAALLLAAAGWRSARADAPSVLFLSPKNLSATLGASTIELALHVPDGAHVKHVLLSLDGKRIAKLVAPPWSARWDAGDGERAHFLEALLVLEDGSEARASVRTSPLRIDQVEQVSLVNLYATVRDQAQSYVNDLTQERFRVTENARPQKIERFSTDWKPLRIALVLDTSLSMKEDDRIEDARQAALNLIEILRPEDQGMVVAFSDSVQTLVPFTSDHAALATAVQSVHAKGGTALYDAVWRTAEAMQSLEGRRVIVLLSDGKDEAASGLEPGSLHTEEEALDRALRTETMIFAVGVGKNLASEWDFARRRSLETILREMAETTGGRVFLSARAGKLKKAFEQIAEDLRHQYSIAYTSDDARRDGKWREVRLTTDRPELVVVTRKGYFAPRDPQQKAK